MFSTLDEAWGNNSNPTQMLQCFNEQQPVEMKEEKKEDPIIDTIDSDVSAFSDLTDEENIILKPKSTFKYNDYKKMYNKCKGFKNKVSLERNSTFNKNNLNSLFDVFNTNTKQMIVIVLIGICILIILNLFQNLFRRT
jgi:uncharacterized membrane protein